MKLLTVSVIACETKNSKSAPLSPPAPVKVSPGVNVCVGGTMMAPSGTVMISADAAVEASAAALTAAKRKDLRMRFPLLGEPEANGRLHTVSCALLCEALTLNAANHPSH